MDSNTNFNYFTEDIKKQNRKINAKYKALFYENRHKNKCMITLVANKMDAKQIFSIRQYFFKRLNDYKRRKKGGDLEIAYWSSIEVGKVLEASLLREHIHIQCFYFDITAIRRAYETTIQKFQLLHTDIKLSEDPNAEYDYVIKDYQKIDEKLVALKKERYANQNLITSSHKKTIPNYIVLKLYELLPKYIPFTWSNTYNKYKLMISLLKEKRIIITKENRKINNNEIRVGKYILEFIYHSLIDKSLQNVTISIYKKVA